MKKSLISFVLLPWLSFNLFAQSGVNLFNDALVHTIEINKASNPSLIDTLKEWHYQSLILGIPEKWDTVNVIFDGVTVHNSGIRCKGHESFLQEYWKKPLKIKANKFINTQTIDGIKEFNLHSAMGDPSQMRDKISYDIFRNEGVHTARTSFTKVYINGEYWGLYTIVENLDKQFLLSNFGNNNGNLYESNNTIISPPFTWSIIGQPHTHADTLALMQGMELKTNTTSPDHSIFIKLLDVINNTSIQEFPDSINKYLNVPGFLKIAAIDFVMLNTDGYLNGGGNFYLYYNTGIKKFDWIPFDYNWSINYLLYGSPDDPAYMGLVSNPLFLKTVLLEKIMSFQQFKTQFYQNVCNLLNSQFNSNVINQRVDAWKALIANDVYADTKKSFSNSAFDDNTAFTGVSFYLFPAQVPAIKQFASDRNSYLNNQFSIIGFNCIPSGINEELVLNLTLYPNPVNELLYVQLPPGERILNYEIINVLGQVVITGEFESGMPTTISVSNLKSGLYIFKYQKNLGFSTKLFIKE